MISVEYAEGREAIEALAPEWDLWYGDSSPYAVFCRPAWYLAWLDAYPVPCVGLFTARSAGKLVGVLPLARVRSDVRGLFLSRLAPVAAGPTDYQPPIIDSELAALALPALLDAVRRRFGSRNVQWWANVPMSDPGYSLLCQYFSRAGMRFSEEREVAPRAPIAGLTYAELEKSWAAKHRKLVRRGRKQLEDSGGFLWTPSSAEEVEEVLPEFFRVHDAKWLGQGYPGIFSDRFVRKHFHSMARRLFGRGLHFSTLRCGGIDISYHFGFLSGGWLQWYRPTYRPEFAKMSPSKIHVSLLLDEGRRLGWEGLDFLLGCEPYKLEWASETRQISSIHATGRSWSPAYFWFSKGKPWARQHFAVAYLRARAARLKWKQAVLGDSSP